MNIKMKLNTTENEPENNVSKKEFRLNLLTQEIHFAKMLAGNEFNAALKEKHIKKLSRWLKNRTSCSQEFTDKDCMRLWKGLFYSMWMSDKPLNQENLATKIASLLSCFDRYESSVQFFAMFLKTMALEWNGIDQWRIDKFMMLVRKMTRDMLRIIQEKNWNVEVIAELSKRLTETVLSPGTPRGLYMHFTELFFEEVSKVSNGEIEPKAVTAFLKPFIFYVASQPDHKLVQFAVKSVFNHLLFQSDAGREYKEKFDAWKAMGFPGNSLNELERVEVPNDEEMEDEEDNDENGEENNENPEDNDENEDEEATLAGALDPRAGRVNVVMPEIRFDPLEIVQIFEEMKFKKFTGTRNRKCMNRIISTYTIFASGLFPLGIQKIKVNRDELEIPDVEDKAVELMEFEENLFSEQRELKKMNKRKRKKIIANSTLYEEFHKNVKSKRPKLSPNNSNIWNEEDIVEEQSYSNEQSTNTTTKLNTSNGFIETDLASEKNKNSKKKIKTLVQNEIPTVNGTPKQVKILKIDESTPQIKTPKQQPSSEKKAPKSVQSTPQQTIVKAEQTSIKQKTPKSVHSVPHEASENETPKLQKKKNAQNGWDTPLQEGETEYFIPSKKGKANGLERTVVTNESETSSKKSPSPKAVSTPISRVSLLKSRTLSTPLGLLSSAEKKVKINLKNNVSQEATEYIKQLKHSPSVPFDSAQKPIKGVLKPNLMPSPINPFYKKMIGFKHPNEK